ncbi:MAG: cytochrome c-type biosis protein CcmH [Blastocatellia bacterium]|jgi:cytochrome c-type biogenesis protein CcmH|nr:cytochrome c-type biosis protein CcmH [Blastocatellia bacterium]
MILFVMVCVVLLAIALAFVLPPLREKGEAEPVADHQSRKEANIAVYQDQIGELKTDLDNNLISEQQYREDRDALERRLLDDVTGDEVPAKQGATISARNLVYAVGLGIPIVAIALYFALGNPGALSGANKPPQAMSGSSQAPGPPVGPMSGGQPTQQQIEANVAALAKRLEQNPNDADGWIMLGRSYTSMEKFPEASGALAKATSLRANDAGLWADYAFAMAMANDRSLQGQPMVLISKALQLDPENGKALQLAGSAAFEQKNYKQAIEYWQRLLQKTSPDTEMGQALTARIAEAKRLAAGS